MHEELLARKDVEDSHDSLRCPLSYSLMKDLVFNASGHTRTEIKKHFEACKRQGKEFTCPMTNEPLPNDTLTPNVGKKGEIIEVLEAARRKRILSLRSQAEGASAGGAGAAAAVSAAAPSQDISTI